jgi:hypothetical protein
VQVGALGNLRRLLLRVLHMLQARRWQGSEQRRQRAPHVAEMLQNLSVERSSATSCNSSKTPKEQKSERAPDPLRRDIAQQVGQRTSG